MVRAKYRCDEVAKTTQGGKVTMSPVTSGSPENEKFFKYTPYGQLVMGTINTEALTRFEPGKEYYIDFTEAQ